MIPVILSGGTGTRLWPVSREARPKPFMPLADGQSLLQKTLLRAAQLPGVERILTLTNRQYYFETCDECVALPALDVALDYLLEPAARNTAPALALAALFLMERNADALMLVLPADHLIEDQTQFAAAVERAQTLAQQGRLATFGVVPAAPETGYGYIERADGSEHDVARFVEKPDAETAARYVASGRFLWNAGMFCFRADVFLEALRQHAPELLAAAEACWRATDRREPVELDATAFAALPNISIDYAVMECASNVAVVPAQFDWRDVGSWQAVAELTPPDADGNRLRGDTVMVESRNCAVIGDSRLTAMVGLENVIVVDTPDALLVVNRDRTQSVKEVVRRLKEADHEAYKLHRTVHRPWGTYTVLEEGPRFKIKRIVVKPGRSLSLQMHHHRSEHWVVVAGTAKVVNGKREMNVNVDESTYIPAGHRHRLTNPGTADLVIIEVQSGHYLGEDDIVRFDDRYGRA